MALSSAQLHDLNTRIGGLLDKHFAPIFKPGTNLTFIARTPGNDEADVLVTSESDINDVVALALRSLGRASVGKGVDLVPRSDDAKDNRTRPLTDPDQPWTPEHCKSYPRRASEEIAFLRESLERIARGVATDQPTKK